MLSSCKIHILTEGTLHFIGTSPVCEVDILPMIKRQGYRHWFGRKLHLDARIPIIPGPLN